MNYKNVTYLLLIFCVGLFGLFYYYSNSTNPNYLFWGQHELNRHAIFHEDHLHRIVFLGSSGVAGNNIPKDSTITDYFNKQLSMERAYNLAALERNILDVNIIENLILDKNVKIFILGVDPTLFFENQNSKFATHNIKNLNQNLNRDLLESYLTPTKFENFEQLAHSEPIPPNSFQIWWKSTLLELRLKFWGRVYNKKLYGEDKKILSRINNNKNRSWALLEQFLQTATTSNIIPVVFIEPILKNAYDEDELITFKNKVKDISHKFRSFYFDYSDALPSNHDMFYDFVHLTPAGNKEVAHLLYTDLKMAGLMGAIKK